MGINRLSQDWNVRVVKGESESPLTGDTNRRGEPWTDGRNGAGTGA